MNEREKYFYNNLIIRDEDKIRAINALRSKGLEKHILIKEKLLAWSENKEIEYDKIASTYRYDKRIRNTLFKYISYLEEYYRGIILDNYSQDYEQDFWEKDLVANLRKYKNLNDALEHLDFYILLKQCKNLPNDVRTKFQFIDKHLTKNLFALKELRNAVMHNKFLLLYRGYEKCYVDGVDNGRSSNLKANILNLVQFLPLEVGKKFIHDINSCKEDRNNENDTAWNLPSQIVISLNN